MDRTNRVAVFGSLRKSLHNNYILEQSEFLGTTKTIEKFDMLDYGAFPGLLNDGNTNVVIEVYEVDSAATWHRLDRLEGYPHFYDRKVIETEFGDAWIYFNRENERGLSIVESGDWIEYENLRKSQNE